MKRIIFATLALTLLSSLGFADNAIDWTRASKIDQALCAVKTSESCKVIVEAMESRRDPLSAVDGLRLVKKLYVQCKSGKQEQVEIRELGSCFASCLKRPEVGIELSEDLSSSAEAEQLAAFRYAEQQTQQTYSNFINEIMRKCKGLE